MNKIAVLIICLVPLFTEGQDCVSFFKDLTYKIDQTEINTKVSDFGPSFVGESLWISSFTEKEIQKILRGSSKKVYYNTFSFPMKEGNPDAENKNIELEEISADYHAGPVSYCKQTGELFVTLSNVENPDVRNTVFQKADIRLKIVIVKKQNNSWTLVGEFPLNSNKYSVGHPAISKTGDTLFFTSNMPDKGYGKTDIYFSVRKDGIWGQPQNLGSKVNSKNDDMFPFLLNGNTLIYASRKTNNSDLDIYYSCFENGEFTEPVALDELNSDKDDFGLVVDAESNIGFFASQRSGGLGDDDIYKVTFIKNILVKGKVVEDDSEIPVSEAAVTLLNCRGEKLASTKSDAKGNFSFKTEQNNCLKVMASKAPLNEGRAEVKNNFALVRLSGNYKLELTVKDKHSGMPAAKVPVQFSDEGNLQYTNADGKIFRSLDAKTKYNVSTEMGEEYMNESTDFSTIKKPYGTIKIELNIEKVKVGQIFTLENIYYDFDKWDILPESEKELDKLVKILNDNPAWQVELGSHTDCRGRDSYNKLLSQKRSNSAVEYIVGKGIDKTRIIAKGYGETQLINKCDDGVPCSEAEHRKNRRTEFKILGMDQ